MESAKHTPRIKVAEHGELFQRGMKCNLWGVAVPRMTRDELIIFVGMLDELVAQERRGEGPR